MTRIFSLYFASVFAMSLVFIPTCVGQLDYGIEEGVIVEEVADPWTGSFATGLIGKTGNSTQTDLNMTMDMTRETAAATTNLLLNYFYGSNDIAVITNRAYGQFRQERKFSNPKWSWYYQAGFEWDEFKNFDYRIALHTGLAYMVYKLDDRFLKLRMGAGSSKEVGGVNDNWLPELQMGLDWERKISDRTKLFVNLDLYPNMKDFNDYRLNTNAGMEFVLDEERDINFRLFAINRYDSTPPLGNAESDLEYGIALAVGF